MSDWIQDRSSFWHNKETLSGPFIRVGDQAFVPAGGGDITTTTLAALNRFDGVKIINKYARNPEA